MDRNLVKNNNDKNNRKKSDNKKFNITLIILGIVIVCCVIFIVSYIYKQSQNSKIYDDLSSEVKIETTASAVETQTEKEVIPIDFAKLYDLNPDIYAWIQIPDTEVDYPVLQKAGNDSYYLNVTAEGNSGYPGSIYSHGSENTKDFTDFNTILYGHNMLNGSMFGSLKYYENKDYWTQHPEIVVYTSDKKFVYKIFAAVVYSDDLIPYKYDLNTVNGRQEFLDSVYNNTDSRSIINKDITVNTDSKIITLSTCIGNESDHRYLVIGVLEK